ncbi:hypothetical protein Pint_13775 [Pistacia integerrima]|uniref:Uncharacterized protein n=1 Tax=Pistacia integerrima TaxID=434235 RepID=A0ACC0Y8Y4_9ROSI|nr:hypothetical protein Pint_13775 [Pistacia integerrima]
MSAILCGKRSFFEDIAASPPVSKRIRCSPSSPVRFSSFSSNLSPPSPSSHLFDQLAAIFPHMDKQLLEKALEECGDDLNSAIRSLNELRLGSADRNEASEANFQLHPLGFVTDCWFPKHFLQGMLSYFVECQLLFITTSIFLLFPLASKIFSHIRPFFLCFELLCRREFIYAQSYYFNDSADTSMSFVTGLSVSICIAVHQHL